MPTPLVILVTVLVTLGTQLVGAVLWALYLRAHGQAGALRTTAVIYGHAAGRGSHDHSYSPMIPDFLIERHFTKISDRCVYFRLDRDPAEVWEAEVKFIADRDLGGYDGQNQSQREAAEETLRATYGLSSPTRLSARERASRLDPLANAQFTRERASARARLA